MGVKGMNVVNCKKCGKLFNYIAGAQICPACKEQNEEKFKVVKKYIQENGHCSMQEVCEECDVEVSQIQAWIRQERLQFADDSPIRVPCEGCGRMIGSGRFCNKCKNQVTKNINDMMNKSVEELKNEPRRSNSNRMRFLQNN